MQTLANMEYSLLLKKKRYKRTPYRCSIQLLYIMSWKGPLRVIESSFWLTINKKSDHRSESVVQMLFEHQQVQWRYHCPGETVTVPDHPLSEEHFPNI